MLKERLLEDHEEDFVLLFERLAAPEDISFFQVEELDLLKIALIDDPAEREDRLERHQRRFYWIDNSYGHVEEASVGFFRNRLESAFKEPARILMARITGLAEETRKEKEELFGRYGISQEIRDISKALSFCIWWQDFRKKYIFIANHFTNVLLKEVSRRRGIPLDELEASTYPELLRLLDTGERIDYQARKAGFVEYFNEGKRIDYFQGDEAQKLFRRYSRFDIDAGIKEFKGTVVSRGNAKGPARILHTPKDMDHFSKGDVLVAAMTSPDFILAMRKASAIVTDEGGMTCHAAIVSRELGIPCIVATRIATRVIRDGEHIEVDAERGIVRRTGASG
jgi:phosphohistidine swiveling domain-containing protein